MRVWPGGVLATVATLVTGPPAAAATVDVVNGIPGFAAAVSLDGRVQSAKLLAGRVSSPVRLARGRHQLVLRGGGHVLRRTLLVSGTGSAAAVAHLSAEGRPTVSLFRNRPVRVAPGHGLLAVRQTAAAASLDVLVDGRPLFRRVLAGGQRQASVRAGAHRIAVRPAPRAPVVELGTTRVPARAMTVVYVFGSLAADTLEQLVQRIPVSRAPARVAPGELWRLFPLEKPPPTAGGRG